MAQDALEEALLELEAEQVSLVGSGDMRAVWPGLAGSRRRERIGCV